jgi:iron complex outermembrane recepter protein
MFSKYPGGCTGPTLNSCPPGPLRAVFSIPLNSDEETTSGLDFNGDYRFPLSAGALSISSSMNYIFQERYISRPQGIQCDTANSLGNDTGIYCGGLSGVPKFRGNVAFTYTQGGWLGTLQERMIGAAHLYTGWQSGVEVDNNDIPFIWYTDLRLSYKWDNGLTLYGAIDNLMDKIMPVIGDTPNSITIFDVPYRDDTYDGFGRVYRVGVRWRFGGS